MNDVLACVLEWQIDGNCPDPVEGARTTSAMVWACPKEVTGPSDKNSDGLRSTRKAAARSPKEE
ncbi:hypothetical protein TELCIR_14799, partial [Teladorsagia circumcincta]